jgi:hypothetical protein
MNRSSGRPGDGEGWGASLIDETIRRDGPGPLEEQLGGGSPSVMRRLSPAANLRLPLPAALATACPAIGHREAFAAVARDAMMTVRYYRTGV